MPVWGSRGESSNATLRAVRATDRARRAGLSSPRAHGKGTRVTPQQKAWLLLEFAAYIGVAAVSFAYLVVNLAEIIERYRARRMARKFTAFRRS